VASGALSRPQRSKQPNGYLAKRLARLAWR